MTPTEIQKLRPDAQTVSAITGALHRLAEARTAAETTRAGAEAERKRLLAEGVDAKGRRSAADAVDDAEFTLEQLTTLEADLQGQLAAAEAREAAEATEVAIAKLEAEVADHGKAWGTEVPRLVAELQALLATRGELVKRATELGRSDLVPGWGADLQPPARTLAAPRWTFPGTTETRAAEAEKRVEVARYLRERDQIETANEILVGHGFPAWPANGPEKASVTVGAAGRTYFVGGQTLPGGMHISLPWTVAVRIAASALAPATLMHPVAGLLRFGKAEAA